MFFSNDLNDYNYNFIYFCSENLYYLDDIDIAKLLDMTLEEYKQLAMQFDASDDKGIIFYSYYDAQKFVQYLNEKYLVILMLAGRI